MNSVNNFVRIWDYNKCEIVVKYYFEKKNNGEFMFGGFYEWCLSEFNKNYVNDGGC